MHIRVENLGVGGKVDREMPPAPCWSGARPQYTSEGAFRVNDLYAFCNEKIISGDRKKEMYVVALSLHCSRWLILVD